ARNRRWSSFICLWLSPAPTRARRGRVAPIAVGCQRWQARETTLCGIDRGLVLRRCEGCAGAYGGHTCRARNVPAYGCPDADPDGYPDACAYVRGVPHGGGTLAVHIHHAARHPDMRVRLPPDVALPVLPAALASRTPSSRRCGAADRTLRSALSRGRPRS